MHIRYTKIYTYILYVPGQFDRGIYHAKNYGSGVRVWGGGAVEDKIVNGRVRTKK